MNRLAVSEAIAATLKRSARRRSIGIKVHRGEVIVSAPAAVPLPEITHFVQQKREWIEKHLLRQRQLQRKNSARDYAAGEQVMLLGQPLTLVLSTRGQRSQLSAGQLHLAVGEGDVTQCNVAQRKRALEHWYLEQAAQHLPPRIEHFQQLLNVRARGLKIRHYKSRWGSCNRRGELQFNWLLMMAPAAVVDYVVVHELAHLRHFDHSPAFWQLVASVLPNYRQQRQWLKNQSTLFW